MRALTVLAVLLALGGLPLTGCSTAPPPPVTSAAASPAPQPATPAPQPATPAPPLATPAPVTRTPAPTASAPSASATGDAQARPEALRGAVTRQGRHSRVVGTLPAPELERIARLADTAVTQVDAAWPAGTTQPWPRRLEVVAPATPADYDAVLDRAGAAPEPSSVAAVTTGPVGADGLARSNRVVLNPTGWLRLSEAGKRYVLTHETVHVAIRAGVPGRAPAWLTEGFADLVAYAAVPTPRRELTRALRERVVSGWMPADLPTAADLDPAAPDAEVGYLAAWLAAEEVAASGGRDAPARLLSACSRHGGDQAQLEQACADAIPRVVGVSRAELVRRWQARLSAV